MMKISKNWSPLDGRTPRCPCPVHLPKEPLSFLTVPFLAENHSNGPTFLTFSLSLIDDLPVLIVIIFPFSLKIYSHFYWYKSTKCFHIYAIQTWPHPFPNTSRTPFTTSTLTSSSKWFWPKPDSHTGHLFLPYKVPVYWIPKKWVPFINFSPVVLHAVFPLSRFCHLCANFGPDTQHIPFFFEIRPQFPLLRRQQFSFSCSLHNSLFCNRFHAEFPWWLQSLPSLYSHSPYFFTDCRSLLLFCLFSPLVGHAFPFFMITESASFEETSKIT